MTYKTVEVDVDVYLDEWEDQELINELKDRGRKIWVDDQSSRFDNADWNMLLQIVDQQPRNWELDRVREKIIAARYNYENT